MRLTWLVLGVVLTAGAVAFINTDERLEDLPEAAGAGPALQRPSGTARAGAPAREHKQEARARALLEGLDRARAQGNAAELGKLETLLEKEAWDAPSARRYAYRRGRQVLEEAGEGAGLPAVQARDRARRLLSRVLYLPEMFAQNGESTDERSKIMDQIEALNRQVMRYRPGLPGVTRPYEVPSGIRPVQIVSREKLPMGSNAILYWNQGGNLDPKRLRAGQWFLLPLEPLSLHVFQDRRRLGVFIGDWFVKEFRVGIGKEDSPTPVGDFQVHSREMNPDWWQPGGKRIPYGDPRNELGSAWIAIENDEWPISAGYGIHGTNKPNTVGTRCSNGCVRLRNPDATELYDWVRTGSAGGQPTRIYIR